MSRKSITFSLAVLSIVGTNIALAEQPMLVAKVNDNVKESEEFWTPERMRDAKPMPLPRVNQRNVTNSPQVDADAGGPDFEDGRPPVVDMKLENKLLYTPIENLDSPKIPNDRGTKNLNFSSSQLIPLTADTSYPYRTVGKLFFTIPGSGNYVCSASVINKRILLTAGHCVHRGSGGANGYFTNWRFVPALRDGAAPYGTWTWSYVLTTPDWANGNGGVPNAGDYAMIEMKDNVVNGTTRSIGDVTGTLGWQLSSLTPNHALMLGYPCNFDSCNKMHQVAAQNGASVAPNNVEYGSDATGGSSGGPWVQNFGKPAAGQTGGLNFGFNRVIGITSWGYTNAALKTQGSSIPDSRFTTLRTAMCAHQAGNCY